MFYASVLIAGLVIAPAVRAELHVALYPLQAEGLEPDATAELDQLLRLQAEALPGVTPQSRAKIRRAIKRSAGEQDDCQGRLRCLVKVGERTGAGLLVFGSAARRAGGYHLDLKAIDVDDEKILRRAEAHLSGDASALSDATRELLLRLLLPDQLTGTLAVRMLVPGARVLFDGIEVGVTPLEPLPELQPRLYTVEVVLEGAAPLRTNVQVRQASTTTLRVDLEDGELSGTPEHVSHLEKTAPSTVAHRLARRLQTATPPEQPVAAAVEIAEAPASAPGADPRDVEAAESPALSTLMLTGFSLVGAGALVGLIGAGGVAAWGVGYANASQYVDPGGSVNDPERFDQAISDQGLHVGLGTAGGVGASVGLIALASGIGLILYDSSNVDDDTLGEADE